MSNSKEQSACPEDTPDQVLDTSGLNCPMPLLKTKLALNGLAVGARLQVIATDPGSGRDIPAFLKGSPHKLTHQEESEGRFWFVIERG